MKLLGLLQKEKIGLLMGCLRLSPQSFPRLLWYVLADSIFRKRHMVFWRSTEGCTETALELEEIADNASLQAFLADRSERAQLVHWGDQSWFTFGWHCWGARRAGKPVCLGWIRTAAQSPDFFLPLSEDTELLWHVTTFPEARGRNLQIVFWRQLMKTRGVNGVAGVFTNCREYNLPSRRNIHKSGFKMLGYCDEKQCSGKRIWVDKSTNGTRA